MYSSSTILVFTMGNGVNGFTLDPQIGEFVLTHPDIQVPKRGKASVVHSFVIVGRGVVGDHGGGCGGVIIIVIGGMPTRNSFLLGGYGGDGCIVVVVVIIGGCM